MEIMPVSVQRPLQPIKANDRSLSASHRGFHPNADTTSPTLVKPDRPCDACRRRKSRCVINTALSPSDAPVCTMCAYQKQPCTFKEGTVPRKRKAAPIVTAEEHERSKKRSPEGSPGRPQPDVPVGSGHTMNSPQSSVTMSNTLGFQSHRYAKYIGATDEHDIALLDLRLYDDIIGESTGDRDTFRKVGPFEFFRTYEDRDTPNHAQEIEDLDTIEGLVVPHGEALIKLYFQVVHPSFPIVHKKLVLEKHKRNYREFAPAFLASLYALALNWWSTSPTLSQLPKPDSDQLESIAYRCLRDASTRGKLSVVQAGLLLLQRSTPASTWQLTSQLVAMGQDLGLHLDCTHWRIPEWERAIRKRLAWALFMQDTWSALVYGRPPHINRQNWVVRPVDESDFPQEPEVEAEGDDGTEVRKGRVLFTSMITLTNILSEVLDALYSQKSEIEIRSANDSTKAVLERAKPIQLKLRAFFSEIPEELRLDATRNGTLSSVGYLHLAYFATEITLHRRVIRSLSVQTDSYMVQICRSAAKARLISAMDFFNRLKPEHLKSFWYFPSKFNFALIGTFAALCFVTSVTTEEAEFYQRRLQEYRWTLKVSNKSAEFLEIASGILESAVGVLLRVADDIDSKKLEFPMFQYATDDIENYPMNDEAPEQYPSGTGTDDGDYDDVSMGSGPG